MLGRAAAEQQRHPQSLGHVLFSRIGPSGRTSPKGTGLVNRRNAPRSAKFSELRVFGLIVEEVERVGSKHGEQGAPILALGRWMSQSQIGPTVAA